MREVIYKLVLVGSGGFVGSVLRYLASGFMQQMTGSISYPYGTLAVNLSGCFAIGALSHLSDARGIFSTETRIFVFVGLLGGFTTFSTFGNETLNLLREQQHAYALTNIGLHVILGLILVWLGRVAAVTIWG